MSILQKRKSGDKIYCVGNCEFTDVKSAIIHGEDIYGRIFMKDNIDKLAGEKMFYFRELEEISESLYYKTTKEYKELLKIQCLKITKENKSTIKKR